MFYVICLGVCCANSTECGVLAGVRVAEPAQDGHEGRGRGDDVPAHLLHGRQLR